MESRYAVWAKFDDGFTTIIYGSDSRIEAERIATSRIGTLIGHTREGTAPSAIVSVLSTWIVINY